MATITRQDNNNLFGPTVGDKIRLGDTDLYVEIERDLRRYGDEVVYGGGKTLRDGMGLANTITSEQGSLDVVITNVTVIDPLLGVVKADVGIKDGKIAGIGKAGNPNIMAGVDPCLVTGASTDAISGEHLILTAGAIDGHVHLISPQQAYAALSNGITTLFGGGIGPTDGTNGTTITSGRWNTEMMLQSIEELPVNVGLLAQFIHRLIQMLLHGSLHPVQSPEKIHRRGTGGGKIVFCPAKIRRKLPGISGLDLRCGQGHGKGRRDSNGRGAAYPQEANGLPYILQTTEMKNLNLPGKERLIQNFQTRTILRQPNGIQFQYFHG